MGGTLSQYSITKRTATKKMIAIFSGGENKGQHLRVALGEIYVRKKFFAVTVVSHWNNVPRDVVEFPSVVVFKTQQGARQSHQGSLLHEQLDQVNF